MYLPTLMYLSAGDSERPAGSLFQDAARAVVMRSDGLTEQVMSSQSMAVRAAKSAGSLQDWCRSGVGCHTRKALVNGPAQVGERWERSR